MGVSVSKPQRRKVENFREGAWRCPIGARKFHFYGLDSRSACGKYAILFGLADPPHEDESLFGREGPDDCRGCRREVDRIQAWAREVENES